MTKKEIENIAKQTENYSASDLTNLCREAAMGPLRDMNLGMNMQGQQLRPIIMKDFNAGLNVIKKSTSENSVFKYEQWNQ